MHMRIRVCIHIHVCIRIHICVCIRVHILTFGRTMVRLHPFPILSHSHPHTAYRASGILALDPIYRQGVDDSFYCVSFSDFLYYGFLLLPVDYVPINIKLIVSVSTAKI